MVSRRSQVGRPGDTPFYKVGRDCLCPVFSCLFPVEVLPIMATGTRAHLVLREEVEALGGPVAYVRAWLDYEAQSSAWKTHRAAARQLSLF